MNIIPIEAGQALLVIKLARQQLAEMRKTANSISDEEMKNAARTVVTKYENAVIWLERLAKGETSG